MDTVLVVLTCASAAAAAAFGVSAWRARADEARRSAARIAALSAAIDASQPLAPAAPANHPVAVTSMFATAPGASVQGRPLVKIGVVAGLATALIVTVAMASRDHTAPAAPAEEEAALELVSMRHTRDEGTLTVSGLVRNPRAAAPRSHITAVVFAFDRSGGFVASGRAGLDFVNLSPGDESPFVVKIPGVAGVARYRVSFRTEEGIVRHRDRRADQLPPSLKASADRRDGPPDRTVQPALASRVAPRPDLGGGGQASVN